VESWGHFPAEKRRLMDLMKKNDPSGLIFLSGDVHHGELSKVQVLREKGESLWVEMTSSGLTHTCADSFFNKILCPTMLKTFSEHRLQSRGGPREENQNQKETETENFFIGKNFGLISDASNSTMYSLNFTVIGIDSKITELNYIVNSVRRNCEIMKTAESTDTDMEQNTDFRKSSCFPDPIRSIVMADFPLFIPEKIFRNIREIFAAIILSIIFLFSFCYVKSSSKRKH
jgi:hypothetical protein